jgi:VWFA-related protein
MRWGGLVWGAIAAVALQAQQPPPQQPTFRAESNLVRVDVSVVDRDGEPVTTLTAEDFAVEEDGDPQAIESFKFVAADGQPPPGDDVSLPIRSPEHAAAEAARDDVRVFVIFWDEYHIGRFASAIRAREALQTFVTTAFAPMDLVALMDPLLPVDALRFTRDRTAMADEIRKLEGRLGVYMPVRSVLEEAQLQRRDAARVRAEVTLSAVKSAAVHLGSLKEGRKAIILVSEGFFALPFDEFYQIRELTEAANNNNTAIYTIDPRGLVGNSSDFLRTIAAQTGGEAYLSTNTPERSLRQVIKDASGFYLLGYSSTKNPEDGKFHSIKVRVKRRGVTVRARRGYWAPNPTERERARAEAAAGESIPADVTSALSVLSTARAERTIDLWVGTARGSSSEAEVTAAWTARGAGAAGGTNGRPETVSITARGNGDDKVYEAPLAAGRIIFPAPPGDLQLRTLIRDRDGHTVDEDTRSLTVPDYAAPALALSVPVLFRARNAAEARAIAGDAPDRPFAGREFVRTDRLFVRFSVYGAAAAEAQVSAQLTNRSGIPLLSLPVAPDGEESYQIEWPLGSQARGDYLMAIEAVRGEERARVLVPLRVVP